MNLEKLKDSQFNGKVKETVKMAENIRKDKENPQDVSFSEIVKDVHNISYGEFLHDLGINPYQDTIENITTTGDLDVRWIIPELFRDALRLGINKAPIWGNVTAEESTISQRKITMPYLNEADATPKYVGEGETIPTGTISYGQKDVNIYKLGRGIKIPYEVAQYSTLNVVSLFLTDFGKKLGLGLDTLAIDTLINGEQSNGSESAPVVGVGTASNKAYADFLRIWIRTSRIGRTPSVIIGGEDAALGTLDLSEFKTNQNGTTAAAGVPSSSALGFKTPLPASSSYYVHGNVPVNQEILVDPSGALIKFNSQPLMVESEKIVSNQTEAFYASLTTGFAKVFRDSTVIMDESLAFSGNGFPSWMDVDSFENIVFE